MLIEAAPLEAGHREGSSWPAGCLPGLQFGQAHGAETRIEMKPQLGCRARLAITQAGELLGVAEQKLNGMITNDKFCCTRWTQLPLSWWRRPLRLRRASDHDSRR